MSWFVKKEFDGGGGKRLFDPRGRAVHGIDFLGFFKNIICFFKKKSLGTAILETALKNFAEKLREREKKAKQIICAIMRKLFHIIFGVLKYDVQKFKAEG